MTLLRFARWNTAWISGGVAILLGASLITHFPFDVRAEDTADSSQPGRPIDVSGYLSGTMYQFLLAEPVVPYRHAVFDWLFDTEFFDYIRCYFSPTEFAIRMHEWRISL